MPGRPMEDKLRAEALMPGVALLRRRRGSQRVAFDEVADHLVDYVASSPAERAVVDRLASFLAEVEKVDHDHRAPAGSAGA